MQRQNPKNDLQNADDTVPLRRLIGDIHGKLDGPTVVFVGGLHGNEPAGVSAMEKVAAGLRNISPGRLRGRFVAVAGNLAALSRKVRYVDEDLNRIWDPSRIEGISSNGQPEEGTSVEALEQLAIIHQFREIFDGATGRVFVFDLHTTSSRSRPFVNIADTLSNRRFARGFPVPIILGIEEQLDCTLLNYINTLGHIAVGFEGGQHDAESAVDNHEAFIWRCLVLAGMADKSDVEQYDRCFDTLERAAEGIKGFFEIRERYHVEDGARFSMLPGFESFQRIRRGQLLARDQQNEILAPSNGRILMPLYQSLGNDGFFTVRSIHRFWLPISVFLRRLHLETALQWLPGVHRHPQLEQTFVIDTRVARWLALEWFHLLGFRKERYEGKRLIVTRRKNIAI